MHDVRCWRRQEREEEKKEEEGRSGKGRQTDGRGDELGALLAGVGIGLRPGERERALVTGSRIEWAVGRASIGWI